MDSTVDSTQQPAVEGVVERVGVVGLGTMGAGIVEVLARHGLQVVAVETDDAALDRGRGRLEGSLGRAAARGRITEQERDDALAAVTYATDLAALADVDLVVEAVPEVLAIKLDLLGRLDDVLRDDAVLATNTSGLSVTRLAVATRRPGRVVGMHFFNPAPVQRLVEVVSTVVTDDAVVARVTDLARRLGKNPVAVTDRAGFVANWLLLAYLDAATRLLEAGRGTREDIDTAVRTALGYPMGPFALMDLIGLDTCLQILETMHEQTRDPLHAPAPRLVQLVAAGRLGRKTGAGFYTYDAAGREVVADALTPAEPGPGSPDDVEVVEVVDDVLAALAGGAEHPERLVALRPYRDTDLVEVVRGPLTGDAALAAARARVRADGGVPVVTTAHAGGIVDALLVPYVNEAVRLVETGYATADDVDTAMRDGCALPKGPIEVLDELGAARVLAVQEAVLAETRQAGHAPSSLLVHLVAAGRERLRG